MSTRPSVDRVGPVMAVGPEPGRSELREITLRGESAGATRREFLKVFGGGVVVAFVTRNAFGFASRGGVRRTVSNATTDNSEAAEEIGAWLQIDEHGMVTVYTGKVEFGQGIRTSLAQEVAEELRVSLESIRLVMGDTELTPFDMGTFGSRSTPQMGTQLRKASAAARELLVGLAAERWQAERTALTAADGRVVDPKGNRSIGYGELTAGRRLTETVRDDVALTPPTEWKIAGTAVPKVGARDVVTGHHQYTSDLTLPGMLFGKVLRPRPSTPPSASWIATAPKAFRKYLWSIRGTSWELWRRPSHERSRPLVCWEQPGLPRPVRIQRQRASMSICDTRGLEERGPEKRAPRVEPSHTSREMRPER